MVFKSPFTIHPILFSFLLNKRIQSAGTIPSSITGCGNAGATDAAVNTTEFTAMGYLSTNGCSGTVVASVCPGAAATEGARSAGCT